MRIVEVFKRTSENWRSSYQLISGESLVLVSFIAIDASYDDKNWRVCVCGSNDCGMESDFINEKSAWSCFIELIGLEDITFSSLKDRGFVSA